MLFRSRKVELLRTNDIGACKTFVGLQAFFRLKPNGALLKRVVSFCRIFRQMQDSSPAAANMTKRYIVLKRGVKRR